MAKIQVTSPDGSKHWIELQTKYAMIGRSATCEVRLLDKAISAAHAKLDLSGTEPYLLDLGSTNGTRVNEKQLEPNGKIQLHDQDVIWVGNYALLFVWQETSDALTKALSQDAAAEDQRPFLWVINGPQAGTKVFFQEPNRKITIGRGEDCELALVDAGASRRHAMIQCSMDGAHITDLGSKHGTMVNQALLAPNQTMPIKDQQEIQIGQTLLRFSDPEEALVASLLGAKQEVLIEPTAPAVPAPTAKQEPQESKPKPADEQIGERVLWSSRELFLVGLGVLCWVAAVGLGWEAFG